MKKVKTIANPMHKSFGQFVVDEYVRFTDKDIVRYIGLGLLIVTLAFCITVFATEHYTPMWDTPVEYACHVHTTLTIAGLTLGAAFLRVIAKFVQKLR